MTFLQQLFSGADFMPHGHCYLWDPVVLWLNVLSDSFIAASYYAIPFLLIWFARRRKDLSFHWIFLAFAGFILACGTTHLLAAYTVWVPVYRLDGLVKAVTAVSSVATAALLVPLLPGLVKLPSPLQLERMNRTLAKEIEERKAAQNEVQKMNAELEDRVRQRTLELESANEQLRGALEDRTRAEQALARANQDLRDQIARRESLEKQLIHAQKMEAIGRLAGGVAHDFNNLLVAVYGSLDLLAEHVATEPAHGYAQDIRDAADRASALTRQLLAFGRRQTAQPEVLDMNEAVRGMEKMMRRIIGSDVVIETELAPGLPKTVADPTQVDQIILNLVVNARDAMPRGGKLLIRTGTATFDGNHRQGYVGAGAGQYVTLSVRDAGTGMDAETKQRLFEPFFTTKEIGRGTGLGLSIVYAIVKGAGGEITVESESGKGTTVTVYLPVREEAETRPRGTVKEDNAGTGTILVVDDEPGVLRITAAMLRKLGYEVFEADSGAKAMRIASERSGRIDLLLTDIMMPAMTGIELAKQMQSEWPQVKVLYMSGHTPDRIHSTHGTDADLVVALNKPFTLQILGAQVREALG